MNDVHWQKKQTAKFWMKGQSETDRTITQNFQETQKKSKNQKEHKNARISSQTAKDGSKGSELLSSAITHPTVYLDKVQM